VGLRSLVADDDERVRTILEEQLRNSGMRVASVASGADALRALRDGVARHDPFQVAILDDRMPDLDGEALGRSIREDPAIAGTLRVLLTSSPRSGDAKRASSSGFTAYLPKPIRPSILCAAIAVAWGSRARGAGAPLITRHSLSEAGTLASVVPAPNGARVLLVEDNVVNQRVGRLMLEKLGCRVDIAANGLEAVDMVRHLPYDLVFMDCQMPEMDGFEATIEIRRRQEGPHRLPIVAMTANVLQGDRERCFEAGMDDYLSKPIDRAGLRRTLEQWAPRIEAIASV
jgi:CheY-like chemotaxis protein